MTPKMRHWANRGILKLIVCTWIAIAGWGLADGAPYWDPARPGFYATVQLVQPDGRLLIGGGMSTPGNPMPATYSFGIERFNGAGTPDTSFNGSGFIVVPVWGYYEFVAAIAIQPDGKIVVGGNAADPTGWLDPLCYPAFCKYYPALVRLNPDGTLDRTFNGNGRLTLEIGDANRGSDVQDYGILTGLELQPDGKIVIRSDTTSTAVARVNPDGTLDQSFVGTDKVARELRYVEPTANFEGLWWNSPAGTESGWGINFAQQGDVIFATWFTYDPAGKPWWLSATLNKVGSDPDTYAGPLVETRGPAFGAAPFDPNLVTRTVVGSATVTFDGVDQGRFGYDVKGTQQTKTITRMVFRTLPTCIYGPQPDFVAGTNYQDLWWVAGGAESGWGISLAHQGDVIFATWFTYDFDGTPLWLSMTAFNARPGVYSGDLIRTRGPAFSATPFDPALVTRTVAGSATFTFSNGNAGTFAYTVNGVTQTKPITRELFAPPAGTLCQ
jgi:uncharacterized delta-60 repeat protein